MFSRARDSIKIAPKFVLHRINIFIEYPLMMPIGIFMKKNVYLFSCFIGAKSEYIFFDAFVLLEFQ